MAVLSQDPRSHQSNQGCCGWEGLQLRSSSWGEEGLGLLEALYSPEASIIKARTRGCPHSI